MKKHKHTIGPCTLVTVELSRWGTHLLTLDNTEEMDEFEARQQLDEHEPKRGLGFIPRRKPSVVRMQLWEAMRIFGPHITSSFRLPFMSIEAELPASEHAINARAEAATIAEDLKTWTAIADRYRCLLNKIAPLIDIGKLEYCAPEEIELRVHDHLNFDVPRQPNAPGLWWYGDTVVRVAHMSTTDHELPWPRRHALAPGAFFPVVIRANGRRTPVDSMPDEWGGPARRDPRVELAQIKEADEDIPF